MTLMKPYLSFDEVHAGAQPVQKGASEGGAEKPHAVVIGSGFGGLASKVKPSRL